MCILSEQKGKGKANFMDSVFQELQISESSLPFRHSCNSTEWRKLLPLEQDGILVNRGYLTFNG
jgi:Neuraminidase (sialidase)